MRFAAQLALICAALCSAVARADAIRVVQDRVFVPVTVAGTTAQALLDSGAEMTLVDTAFARRLGLELEGHDMAKGSGAGRQPVRFASGVDIESVGTHLADQTVAVIDLSDISRRLVGEPLDVVLGRALFDAGRFVLDIETATLVPAAPDAPPAGVRLPVRDRAGIPQIPVTVEGLAAWADFDLGNGSGVLVGADFARTHGLLEPGRLVGSRAGGGIGGETDRDLIRLASLGLAGRTFTDLVVSVDRSDDASDANVGVCVLRHFLLTVDLPAGSVWLLPRRAADAAGLSDRAPAPAAPCNP